MCKFESSQKVESRWQSTDSSKAYKNTSAFKYFAHFHVPSFYDELHLLDALFARTQTSFGVGQTVYFSFINTNVSIKQILLTWFIIFPISCLQTEESSQRI